MRGCEGAREPGRERDRQRQAGTEKETGREREKREHVTGREPHHHHTVEVPPTRWSTTVSSKVNLYHAINFRALCGANLVTLPRKTQG